MPVLISCMSSSVLWVISVSICCHTELFDLNSGTIGFHLGHDVVARAGFHGRVQAFEVLFHVGVAVCAHAGYHYFRCGAWPRCARAR